MATLFYVPAYICEGSNFSLSLLTLVIVRFFFDIAVSVVIRWYLMVVLICIPLMAKDADQLFTCMLVIPMLALVRCLFRNCPIYFTGLFVFSSLNIKISLYILAITPLSDTCFSDTFFQSVVFSFHSLDSIFCRADFNLNKIQHTKFFFHGSCFY